MNANELRQIDFCNPDSINYANSRHYIDQLESLVRQQQAEIEALKQQVAFLEDWRDTWSPTIKQLMNINVKAQEK